MVAVLAVLVMPALLALLTVLAVLTVLPLLPVLLATAAEGRGCYRQSAGGSQAQAIVVSWASAW